MKKTLLATTILAATAFAANAASTSFNGAYLGAQAGYVQSNTKTSGMDSIIKGILDEYDVAPTMNKKSKGLLFGVYAGYGKNLNGFYIGGEMSILGDTAKRTINQYNWTMPNGFGNHTMTVKYKRGIVFGLAPRMGFVFGENLIYVKPGIEISRDKSTITETTTLNRTFVISGTTFVPGTYIDTVSKTKTNITFAPAIGYERAMGKVLLRAEYTYNCGGKISDEHGGKVSYSDNRFVIGAAYKF